MHMSDPMSWLLDEIDAEVRETRKWIGRERLSPAVRQALLDTPRSDFVPVGERACAWDNRPLPIGHGQTISQPYIVAIMTDLLDPQPHHVVLEVGTGSGYQAAVLSRLVRRVFSMELVPELAQSAGERLRRLGYGNVETRQGDAWGGWPEHAPYDAVIVTAAAPEIPPALLDQLAVGGRMILPVDSGWGQDLLLVSKDADGHAHKRKLLPVAFVPFVHRHEH